MTVYRVAERCPLHPWYPPELLMAPGRSTEYVAAQCSVTGCKNRNPKTHDSLLPLLPTTEAIEP